MFTYMPVHKGSRQELNQSLTGPSGGQGVIDLLSLMAGSERMRSHYSQFLGPGSLLRV